MSVDEQNRAALERHDLNGEQGPPDDGWDEGEPCEEFLPSERRTVFGTDMACRRCGWARREHDGLAA